MRAGPTAARTAVNALAECEDVQPPPPYDCVKVKSEPLRKCVPATVHKCAPQRCASALAVRLACRAGTALDMPATGPAMLAQHHANLSHPLPLPAGVPQPLASAAGSPMMTTVPGPVADAVACGWRPLQPLVAVGCWGGAGTMPDGWESKERVHVARLPTGCCASQLAGLCSRGWQGRYHHFIHNLITLLCFATKQTALPFLYMPRAHRLYMASCWTLVAAAAACCNGRRSQVTAGHNCSQLVPQPRLIGR